MKFIANSQIVIIIAITCLHAVLANQEPVTNRVLFALRSPQREVTQAPRMDRGINSRNLPEVGKQMTKIQIASSRGQEVVNQLVENLQSTLDQDRDEQSNLEFLARDAFYNFILESRPRYG